MAIDFWVVYGNCADISDRLHRPLNHPGPSVTANRSQGIHASLISRRGWREPRLTRSPAACLRPVWCSREDVTDTSILQTTSARVTPVRITAGVTLGIFAPNAPPNAHAGAHIT